MQFVGKTWALSGGSGAADIVLALRMAWHPDNFTIKADPNIMKQALSLYRSLFQFDPFIDAWGGALLGLALRLFVGWQFFKAGLTKVRDWDSTLALFRDEYRVPLLSPELAAVLGAAGELCLPILLFAGLVSRPAAFGLFAVNAMAVISYPQLLAFDCPAAINDHFYWGVLLLALVAYGPGRLSLDVKLGSKD